VGPVGRGERLLRGRPQPCHPAPQAGAGGRRARGGRGWGLRRGCPALVFCGVRVEGCGGAGRGRPGRGAGRCARDVDGLRWPVAVGRGRLAEPVWPGGVQNAPPGAGAAPHRTRVPPAPGSPTGGRRFARTTGPSGRGTSRHAGSATASGPPRPRAPRRRGAPHGDAAGSGPLCPPRVIRGADLARCREAERCPGGLPPDGRGHGGGPYARHPAPRATRHAAAGAPSRHRGARRHPPGGPASLVVPGPARAAA
jgi:hypothetical protein